jgi:hypothetical protein
MGFSSMRASQPELDMPARSQAAPASSTTDGEVQDVAPAFSESDLQLDPQHITRTSRVISDLKLIVVLCPVLRLAVAGLVPAGCNNDTLRRWRKVSNRSVDGLLEH